jgi:hypothetical protein
VGLRVTIRGTTTKESHLFDASAFLNLNDGSSFIGEEFEASTEYSIIAEPHASAELFEHVDRALE